MINKIDKAIFRIALPAVVSNITVPLLGVCDTAVTGHLGHPRFIAAIAVGTMMLNVLFLSLGFLRMGTTGLTAQAYGASDRRAIRLSFTRALLLAFAIGLMLILLQNPLLYMLMHLIGVGKGAGSLAQSYYSICIWGAPFLLGTMAVSGWFLGMQDSSRPMLIAVLTNVVNIAASVVLVFPLRLGFVGTAIGTLSANCLSLLLALLLVRRFCGGTLPLAPLREAVRLGGLRRFFKVNTDIFLRSIFIMAVSLDITATGARLGELTLAANAIVMQLFFIFSYFMDGFAFSAEALSGKCAGAADYPALRCMLRRLMMWATLLAMLFTVAYAFGYPAFTRMLAPEPEVLVAVSRFRLWIALLPLCSFLAFIFDGVYIGLTATRPMLIVTAAASVLFFVLNSILPSVCPDMDAGGCMWMAFIVYLSLRGVALTCRCPRVLRRHRNNS